MARLRQLVARLNELRREIAAIQSRIKAVQALLAANADPDLIEGLLRDVGLSAPADYGAAMIELNRRLMELRDELVAIQNEINALLRELQDQANAPIDEEDISFEPDSHVPGWEPASVSDSVGAYPGISVDVTIRLSADSRAGPLGKASDAITDTDVDPNRWD